jgi:hypothetical protein
VKLPLAFTRTTSTARDLRAGCFACHGKRARWTGANAQALAARHHDRTGHPTWCDIAMQVRYGRQAPDDRQHDIEDAIASASLGDAPGCAPLPDFDAPAVSAADVSAPVGRSSKPALAAAQPETCIP